MNLKVVSTQLSSVESVCCVSVHTTDISVVTWLKSILTEDRRLSRPRHCGIGMQITSIRAIYHICHAHKQYSSLLHQTCVVCSVLPVRNRNLSSLHITMPCVYVCCLLHSLPLYECVHFSACKFVDSINQLMFLHVFGFFKFVANLF